MSKHKHSCDVFFCLFFSSFSQVCGIVSDAYGGKGGNPFNEIPTPRCNSALSKVVIRSGKYIDAIELTYVSNEDGSYSTLPRLGGNGGHESAFDIDVRGGEKIKSIQVRSGEFVDHLNFTTNKGRSVAFGGYGGSQFSIAETCDLQGIYGRAGEYLDAIGFICADLWQKHRLQT